MEQDFNALAPCLELPIEPKFEDFVDVKKIAAHEEILNSDHTVALVKGLKRDPEGELERFELLHWYGAKKKEMERQALALAVMLKERHGYSLNDELLTETIWHLKQAGFMGASDLTAYYFKKALPIIIQGDGCYLLFAPKIE